MYNTKHDVDALVSALREIIVTRGRSARTDQTASLPLPAPAQSPLTFPKASAATPNDAAEELEGIFTFLESRDDRSAQVIEMGEKLPHTFNTLKMLTQRVPGCMSEVYLLARPMPEKRDHIEFIADANAEVVRGLIAMLTHLFSGQRAADVLAFNIEAFFTRIGLDQFITSQRRNGLAGMIQRIHTDAGHIAEAAHGR